MKSKAAPILLATVAALLVVGVGVAIAGKPSPSKTAPTPKDPTQGYTVQDACAGVVVDDEAAAMAHAATQGALAGPYDPNAQMGWIAKAAGALGIPLLCDPAKIPSPSLTFTYRLFQAYLQGGVKAGAIQEPQAVAVASTLRSMFVTAGADPSEMPEGLGG